MFNRIKEALPAIPIPGRLLSSAGSALFGTKAFLDYVYRGAKDNLYTHPVSIASVAINVVVNCSTRIPAFFRSHEIIIINDSNISESSDFPPDDEVITINGDANGSSIINDAIQQNDTISESETSGDQEAGLCTKAFSNLLSILCHTSNAVTGIGLFLTSYNNGKILSEFIAAQVNGSIDDEPWKYYIVHTAALYIACSNVYSFATYISASVNKNRDAGMNIINGKSPSKINIKMATSATILATLNLSSLTAFNLRSNMNALTGINKDLNTFPAIDVPENIQIPKWAMMTLSSTMSISGLFTGIMTIIPELYSNLDSIFNSDQQEDNPSDENFIEPKWKQALRYTLYGIGAVDAINVGLQGHSSVVLVMHDLLNIDPYGYIMNLGLLCGISTVLCQFSFFSKKGIDDTMNDLQKYINRSNTDAPQLIIEEGKTETSQLLSV